MGPAVVLGDDFDAQVVMAALELVLEADVGKVHALIEVREVVLARPLLDLARVPIGPAVAVRAVAIPFLQELLVLPLELALHNDVPDVRAALTELAGGVAIGVVDARVVRQLAAIHAVAVAVAALVVAVAAMDLEQLTAAVGEDDCAVAFVERHRLQQAFVAEMVEAVGAGIERAVAQVALGNDAERANGRERAAVFTVQLVRVIVIPNDFPLEPAREMQVLEQHVARIVRIAVARVPAVVAFELAFVADVALSWVRVTERRATVVRVPIPRIDLVRIAWILPHRASELSNNRPP